MPEGYARRDFNQGPETYRSQSLLDTIFSATGLKDFNGSAVVVDLMSGPGGVAFGVQERAPQHNYAVLDASQGQLEKIDKPVKKILGDVRDLPSVVENGSIDVATVRYGLKDIPQDQQPGVISGINHILKPGGVLVIADMFSPEGAKGFTNEQHSRKQELSGRNIQEEGKCYIPTEQEWLSMLRDADFEPEVVEYYLSRVSTSDWLRGSQFGDPKSPEAASKKAQMDEIILGASDAIKKQFNIREESGEVKIDYPVVIIRAVKKDIKTNLPNSGEIYAAK